MLPSSKMTVSPVLIVRSVGEKEKPELVMVTVVGKAIPEMIAKTANSIYCFISIQDERLNIRCI